LKHLQKGRWKGEKGTTLFVTLQHWIKLINNQASARTNRPHHLKEGESSVSFGHIKKTVTMRISRMMEANIVIQKLMCEEQNMHDERVWNIKHGLVRHSFAAGPAAR
jgi:hypothetical protein